MNLSVLKYVYKYILGINKCIYGISHKEHKTNEYVWQRVNVLAGRQELLLSTVKRRKFS